MKLLALCIGLFAWLLTAPATGQDFDRGVAAYERGDYAAALREFRVLAAHGHPVAQANLSIMYFHGTGLPRDEAEAADWAFRAAEQGYASAQAQLGYIYLNATGPLEDAVEAANWYRRAAEQGHDVAQTTLGTLYYQGLGVDQDFAAALKWFRRAAAQGNADAYAKLGVAYYRGDGVPQDDTQAYVWLSAAAEVGHRTATTILDFLASKMDPRELAEARRLAQERWQQPAPSEFNPDAGGSTPRIITERGLYPNRY